MAQIKIEYNQFLESAPANHHAFMQDLHDYLLENGCKPTYEEKKSGLLGSYKHTKSKKVVINPLLKKQGLFIRIYGENISEYPGFLNTLPTEMIQSIDKSGECTRLTQNKCSPKCKGYDFTIEEAHFQKCRYNCFEFLVTEESKPYIKAFVEHEVRERTAI